jgi:hypothetical protein
MHNFIIGLWESKRFCNFNVIGPIAQLQNKLSEFNLGSNCTKDFVYLRCFNSILESALICPSLLGAIVI